MLAVALDDLNTLLPDEPRRERCPACGGSGDEYRVTNPEWPGGSGPHREATGDPCPECGGTGRAVRRVV